MHPRRVAGLGGVTERVSAAWWCVQVAMCFCQLLSWKTPEEVGVQGGTDHGFCLHTAIMSFFGRALPARCRGAYYYFGRMKSWPFFGYNYGDEYLIHGRVYEGRHQYIVCDTDFIFYAYKTSSRKLHVSLQLKN